MNQVDIKSKFEFFRKNNFVYLDNAATTQVPDTVINAVDQILEYRGNPHRGAHVVAEKNGKALGEARENIARFVNATSEEIVFTGNTTDSINLAVDSINHLIEKGDEIILSYSEHHSNILPFEKLVRKGAKIKAINLNKEFKVDLKELKEAITKKTKIVALNHISNVLGVINNIEEIGVYLKKNYPKILFLIDGAQAIAHIPVDVKKINCDIYAFSSHKMYGPCGVGVLYINKKLFPSLKPVRAGGGTVKHVSFVKGGNFTEVVIDFKQGLIFLEGGTPNTSNIVGLSKAVGFIRSIGFDYIVQHEKELIGKLINGLGKLEGIKIFGPTSVENKSGLVSFSFKDIPTKEVGEYLDKKNICIRHGSHCAFPLIDYLGSETLRASIGVYNDESDVDTLLQELKFFIDKKKGRIVNKNLEPLRENIYYRQLMAVNSREQILEKIRGMISNSPDTEIVLMAGHFLGIPDMQEDKFWPGIKQMMPERLHPLLDEFGMTSFPLFTWELGCEITSTLKKEGFNVRLSTIANDTTGINEIRLSPTNTKNRKAEDYEKQLINEFKQPKIPKIYSETLKKYLLNEEDIIESSIDNKNEKFFNEKGLRGRFKEFISKNKEYFDGVINYVPLKDGSWDLSINILDNQEIKTCRFDTFGSKTGGKFCIVEVCEFIAELFGKSKEVKFNYLSERVLNPKSPAKNKVLVMLTPAMCDDAVSRGAELYIKLMLQEKGEGSFKFLNVPLGPNSSKYLATGATLKYLSDKGLSEEISVEKEPDFPELWKLCEYKLLYNAEEYTDEITELFKNLGINKKSKILDTCVGPGFFSSELLERGYNLNTADKSSIMVKPFINFLKEKGIKNDVKIVDWLNLPKHFKKESFDVLFNRGNTFIYAGGGWNEKIKINEKTSIESFKKTLQIYYNLLKKNGYLYIDKFKDSEVPSKKIVARLNIKSNNTKKDIVFYVERKQEEGIRYAQMLLRDMNGKEEGLPNMAYDLTEDKMEDLLKQVGFKEIKKIKLRNEKHFVVWLAKK
ncbi:aminotransferase class V-fold PLP-dependent enzyme [Candidatus Pacearchaeota archaeon]|nr:aminotransferase class V-fold PLP-dependent enzyme [Candidatus Pacearchaeota archaeon]